MAIPYFDAHCDTVTRPGCLRRDPSHHLDLERLARYAPAVQLLAVFAPPGRDGPGEFERLYAAASAQIEENKDLACLCRNGMELSAAAAAGKIALLLGVEGANLLDCSVPGLKAAYARGVRLVTLCWNQDNRLCGSAQDTGSGLTDQGRAFTDACWELGVAVDLSHASERTFYDVVGRARRPVICSHSDCQALCDHPRNLTDGQIRALVGNDGFVGLNLYAEFLGLGRDISAVIDHAEHFLDLGAEKNLGLGTDFDGIDEAPAGLKSVEEMGALYDAMLRRGFAEELVRDIFFGNLRRYFDRAIDASDPIS